MSVASDEPNRISRAIVDPKNITNERHALWTAQVTPTPVASQGTVDVIHANTLQLVWNKTYVTPSAERRAPSQNLSTIIC